MRTINLGNGWTSMLEKAVEVVPHAKARFLYVDVADVDAVPALAIPSGIHTREAVLDELFGFLRNHVQPYCERDVLGKHLVVRVEMHAVDNLDAVAAGEPGRILASSFGKRKNRKSGGRQQTSTQPANPEAAAGVPSRVWANQPQLQADGTFA